MRPTRLQRWFLLGIVLMALVPLCAQSISTVQSQSTRPVSTERFEDYIRAHMHEHDLEREALTRARETTDARLGEMNNLRAQLNLERGVYVTRVQYDAQLDRIGRIEQQLASVQSANVTWTAAVGLFFTVVMIGLRFMPSKPPKDDKRGE
jgi:hypothetical protein